MKITMKRKRNDSTTNTTGNSMANKILCLQSGSNVEVRLDDGKWYLLNIIIHLILTITKILNTNSFIVFFFK